MHTNSHIDQKKKNLKQNKTHKEHLNKLGRFYNQILLFSFLIEYLMTLAQPFISTFLLLSLFLSQFLYRFAGVTP